MYVGVLHTVTDAATWAVRLVEMEDAVLPIGVTNPISYIGADSDYAFCLWETPSVEELQPVLDRLLEGAATNLYFEVDPNAFGTAGIPRQRSDVDSPISLP